LITDLGKLLEAIKYVFDENNLFLKNTDPEEFEKIDFFSQSEFNIYKFSKKIEETINRLTDVTVVNLVKDYGCAQSYEKVLYQLFLCLLLNNINDNHGSPTTIVLNASSVFHFNRVHFQIQSSHLLVLPNVIKQVFEGFGMKYNFYDCFFNILMPGDYILRFD
jgi:hypothetical protein